MICMYIVDFKKLYVLFDNKIRFLYENILQYEPSIKIKYVLLVKDIYMSYRENLYIYIYLYIYKYSVQFLRKQSNLIMKWNYET